MPFYAYMSIEKAEFLDIFLYLWALKISCSADLRMKKVL